MNQRYILVFATLVVVLGIAALFIVFVFRQPTPVFPRVSVLSTTSRRSPTTPAIPIEVIEERAADEVLKIAEKKPTFEFFGTTIQVPTDFVEQLRPFLPQETPENGKVFRPTPAAPPSSVATTSAPSLSLTKEEVFNALYPPFFINGLKDVQNQLTAEGIATSLAVEGFDSEAEIKNFLLAAAGYLLSRDFLSKTEFATFQQSIRDFFDRSYEAKVKEAAQLLSKQPALSNVQFSFPTKEEALEEFYETTKIKETLPPDALKLLPRAASKTQVCGVESNQRPKILSTSLLRGIILFERFFSIPSVRAACGPTYCTRNPICFLEGTGPQSGGSDFVTPCCSGRICGAPIGCLELCGNGSAPFIWDPSSNICGCGIGGGLNSGADLL